MASIFACHDSATVDPQEDYIVFGQFNGFCIGESCIEFFKITPSRLLESNVDEYTEGGFYSFEDFHDLSDDKFQLTKDLGEFMPQQLWAESTTHLGHADVSDVGSLYFEISNASGHRYWVFENGDFDMPQVYSEFMNKIREKISIINQ